MEARAFRVQVPDVLADLRSRLRRTRWPQPLPYPGLTAGLQLDYLRELVEYWQSSFDWPTQERWLNSFPQFTAQVDGQVVHFVHQRGSGPRPFPLVLTHGYSRRRARRGRALPEGEPRHRPTGVGGGRLQHRPVDGAAARRTLPTWEEPELLVTELREFFRPLRPPPGRDATR